MADDLPLKAGTAKSSQLTSQHVPCIGGKGVVTDKQGPAALGRGEEREGRVSFICPPGLNGQADACSASSWKRSLQAILGKVLLG